jgi:hypothetical protein
MDPQQAMYLPQTARRMDFHCLHQDSSFAEMLHPTSRRAAGLGSEQKLRQKHWGTWVMVRLWRLPACSACWSRSPQY